MTTQRSSKEPRNDYAFLFQILVTGDPAESDLFTLLPDGRKDNQTFRTVKLSDDTLTKLHILNLDEYERRDRLSGFQKACGGSDAVVFFSGTKDEKSSAAQDEKREVLERYAPESLLYYQCSSTKDYPQLFEQIATHLVAQQHQKELKKTAQHDYEKLMISLTSEIKESEKKSKFKLGNSEKEKFMATLNARTSELDKMGNKENVESIALKKLEIAIGLLKGQVGNAQPQKTGFLNRITSSSSSLASICRDVLNSLPPQTKKWAEGIKTESSVDHAAPKKK